MEKTRVQAEVEIAASAENVFKALIEPAQVTRWFSEHADISLSEGRYNFWGRFTPEFPAKNQGSHAIVSQNENEEISFGWRIRNADTSVKIFVRPLGNKSSEVTVVHDGLPKLELTQFSMSDFWSMALENLRALVERNEVGARCDFTSTPYGGVNLSIDILASKEKVFEALINPKVLDRYISRNSVVEPKVGGKYHFGWGSGGPVKILEIVPSERLSYSWIYQKEPNTVATWTLEGSGGKTRLTVVHSGFGNDRPCDDYKVGWFLYLTLIKGLIETGPRWVAPKLISRDYAYTLS